MSTRIKPFTLEVLPYQLRGDDVATAKFCMEKGIAFEYLDDLGAFKTAESFLQATKFTGGSYYRPHPAIINYDLLKFIEDEPIHIKRKRRESLMPPNAEQRRRHRETYKNNLAKRFPK